MMPDAQPIDVDHLRSQTLGDDALQAELLGLFSQQAERIVADLAAAQGATAEVRDRRAGLLHLLCGSARAVGAWDVAAGAETLEQDQRRKTPGAGQWSADRLAALDGRIAEARAAIAVLLRCGIRD